MARDPGCARLEQDYSPVAATRANGTARASWGLVRHVAPSAFALLCAVTGCQSRAPLRSFDAATDASCDLAPVAACARPTDIHPERVVDLPSFRAEASAAVCNWSLRCPWGVWGTQSFCHPEFAALYASRHAGLAAFDPSLATTCVAQLTTAADCDTAVRIANDCLDLDVGTVRAYLGEGRPCPMGSCPEGPGGVCPCDFELACAGGVCVRTVAAGAGCDGSHPCSAGLACRSGTCAYAQLGEDCSRLGALSCAPDAVCGAGGCVMADACNAFRSTERPIDCNCVSDDGCPSDVSQCIGGVCTLRPFVGDACAANGATCYGSRCEAGRCIPFGLGEGPCGADGDCQPGLMCGERDIGNIGTCITPFALGGPCRAETDCEPGLVCSATSVLDRGTCIHPFGLGEGPCGADTQCQPGLVCRNPAGAARLV